jgi:hypothetical protein
MAQWGKTDNYQNSVLWGVSGFNATPNTGVGSNRQAFYDNVSRGAYITNLIVGQFGVDATEMSVVNGPVVHITFTNNGSGYSANANLSFSGGGGTGAAATGTVNSSGKITTANITNNGSSYETNPTVTVAAPSIIAINGNTAVSGDTLTLSNANSYFAVNDGLTISANATSTPGGLVSGTRYFVVLANTTAFKLSTTTGGTPITLTKASGDNTTAGGLGLLGDTATAVAVVGGARNKGVTHAGWVVRKVGTGGRAGRVQYETLVAMGTITGDGSDDLVLPDSNT